MWFACAQIYPGSCGFGQIDKDKDPLGWDVVAVPDVSPDYAGSCGTCVELMCDPSNFKDGYGQVTWLLLSTLEVPHGNMCSIDAFYLIIVFPSPAVAGPHIRML